LDLPEQQI